MSTGMQMEPVVTNSEPVATRKKVVPKQLESKPEGGYTDCEWLKAHWNTGFRVPKKTDFASPLYFYEWSAHRYEQQAVNYREKQSYFAAHGRDYRAPSVGSPSLATKQACEIDQLRTILKGQGMDVEALLGELNKDKV